MEEEFESENTRDTSESSLLNRTVQTVTNEDFGEYVCIGGLGKLRRDFNRKGRPSKRIGDREHLRLSLMKEIFVRDGNG